MCDLLESRVRLTPGREAYRQFDVATQKWVSYSWLMCTRVWSTGARHWLPRRLPWAPALAYFFPNSVEHISLDQAALASGYVCVPLHVIDNPESLAYVIADSGAALLLVESAARWAALAPFQAQFPLLQRVVYLGAKADAGNSGIAVCIDDWLAKVEGSLRPSASWPTVAAEALAAIVYTSGTTGSPQRGHAVTSQHCVECQSNPGCHAGAGR